MASGGNKGLHRRTFLSAAAALLAPALSDAAENTGIVPIRFGLTPVFLTSDRSAGTSGQVFACRHNEIFLMSSPRPVRGVHHEGGWTPTQVADIAIPALKGSFMPLDRSGEVFTWDPV